MNGRDDVSTLMPDPGEALTARELVSAADESGFTEGRGGTLAVFLDMLGAYSLADLCRARIYVSREDRGAQPPLWGWDRRPHERERA